MFAKAYVPRRVSPTLIAPRPWIKALLIRDAERPQVGFFALIGHLRAVWVDRLLRAVTAILRQVVISDSEWCALKPVKGAHETAPYVAWGTDGHPRFDNRPVAPAWPTIDTSPLVIAAQRKEADMLLKVLPADDCLQTPAPAIAPVPARAATTSPNDWEGMHQTQLRAQRAHIAAIGRIDTPDRRLWETDHEAWKQAHGVIA